MIKRTVRGVGYNSKGKYKTNQDGKPTKTYSVWYGMIERCYSPEQIARRPNYEHCTVSDEWHDYQDFALWYEDYPYKGDRFQLDKDILVKGNTAYSPNTVCLVPQDINMLFTVTKRGKYPQGVTFNKPMGKYVACLSTVGGSKHLGYFDCPDKAHQAYVEAKEAKVKYMADLWFGSIETRVYEALMDWEYSAS